MDTAPVIEKIRKLLAMAGSANEHEAALAAAHVQRLLSAHNLAMADITPGTAPDRADTVVAEVAGNPPKWVRQLAAGVSSAFDCQAVHHPARRTMTFIGVSADVQVAAYTFSYLDRTLRTLCSRYMKGFSTATLSGRRRELVRSSYYLGGVSTITATLREQKLQTPVTPGALVPVKEGLIKRAMEELGPVRTRHSRRSFINPDAYSRGQADGRQVTVRSALEHSARRRTPLT